MNIFKIPVFSGISENEFADMSKKKCMYERTYEKNDTIFRTGDPVHDFGIVLEGAVHIENIDLWGNKSILSNVGTGQIFAEAYALSREPLMVDVVAASPSKILFIHVETLLSPRNRESTWYPTLLHNLLTASSRKNLTLSNRIFCTTSKNIRTRVLTYLSMQAAKNDSMQFSIPFNRQQMADYLNVDRSALSNELCKMRDDGLLVFRKNFFELKSQQVY